MKKHFKFITLLSAACMLVGVTQTTHHAIAEGIDEDVIQDYLDNYNISKTMSSNDELIDGDIVVLGSRYNYFVCQIIDEKMFFADSQYQEVWMFFKVVKDLVDYPAGKTDYLPYLRLEVLNNPSGSFLNPGLLSYSYNEQEWTSVFSTSQDKWAGTNFIINEVGDLNIISTYNSDASAGITAFGFDEDHDDGEYHFGQMEIINLANRSAISTIPASKSLGLFKLNKAPKATYYPNGAEGESFTRTAKQDTALCTCPFTKAGYCFMGWNTQADGKGTFYSENEIVTLNANTNLYAQWGENPALGYNKLQPVLSLAYQYTTIDLEQDYKLLTDSVELETDDSLIIVSTINGHSYAMNKNFEGEEVVITDNVLRLKDNDDIDNVEYFHLETGMEKGHTCLKDENNNLFACSFTFNYDGLDMSYLYMGGAVGNVFYIVFDNSMSFIAADEDHTHYLMARQEDETVGFYMANPNYIGTEGFASDLQIYYRKNNPYKDVDIRVRLGMDCADYVKTLETFVGKGYDSSKFTSYGIRLWGDSISTRTYDFKNDELGLIHSDGNIRYINLIMGDCLSSYNQLRIDAEFKATPFIVYDGKTYNSKNAREFTIRSLLEEYYQMEETRELVKPLHDKFELIPEGGR